MNALVRSSFVAAAAASALACSSSDPRTVEDGEVATSVLAEIPASPNEQGVHTWRFAIEGSRQRASALDEQGNVIAEFDLVQTEGQLTLEDTFTGEYVVIGPDGAVVENTLSADSEARNMLAVLASDVETFKAEHPETAQQCGWQIVWAWGWCAVAVAVCVHPGGWVTLACVGFGGTCVQQVQTAYVCI
jgi:hypothetical protein